MMYRNFKRQGDESRDGREGTDCPRIISCNKCLRYRTAAARVRELIKRERN